MSPYPFKSIVLNGRDVEIVSILLGTITPTSEFERHTIDFVRDWLNNTTHFVLTTSGSTGHPKPISITRGQMQHSARMTIQALALQKNETALVCLNTHYIAGKMMLVRALEGDLKITVVDPVSDPLKHCDMTFDFIALVPVQLQAILTAEESRKRLDNAKAIIIGGAAISTSLHDAIKTLKSPVYATYGMTETISHVALQRLNGDRPETYFKTLPNIKITTDDRGCLVIDAGYLPEKIHTNDLVEIISPQTFQWLGRVDNVINTGGIKVIPEELESQIQKLNEALKINQNFFISGIPDPILGKKVVLIVEGDVDKNWVKILSELKQTFSKYVIPKEILKVDKFTFTKTEKIDRTFSAHQAMAQYFTEKKH